ncbi:MAG: hypothetical protein LBR28_06505 [Bacteroidales bacterium]|jgi:protein involved in sex pheromone biosynthesis|nr:hypothetical protein [Bacteroidales bacterium]
MKKIIISVSALALMTLGLFSSCGEDENEFSQKNNQVSSKAIVESDELWPYYFENGMKDCDEHRAANCGEVTIYGNMIKNIIDAINHDFTIDYFTNNKDEMNNYFGVKIVNGVINGLLKVDVVNNLPAKAVIYFTEPEGKIWAFRYKY